MTFSFEDGDEEANADVHYIVIEPGVNGNFTGSKRVPFTINRLDVGAKATVTVDPQTYTGEALEPDVKVVVKSPTGNKTLVKGADYEVEYSNNINVGNGTSINPTVKITGIGNYTGEAIQTFTINKVDPSKLSIELSAESAVYDESDKIPDVKVMLGDIELPDDSYTATWTKKDTTTEVKELINAGEYTVTVTGDNIKTGTDVTPATKEFTIEGVSIADAEVTGVSNVFYQGDEVEFPALEVKIGKDKLTKDTDYEVEYKNNNRAGSASVVLTGIKNYGGTKTIPFTIKKGNFATEAEVVFTDDGEVVYDGSSPVAAAIYRYIRG